MLDLNQPPSIFASVHSPRWHSQLQRKIELLNYEPVVHWLLDLQSSITSAERQQDAILIAELPKRFGDRPEETTTLISNACNNPQRAPVFILGDHTNDGWERVFMEAGAAGTCFSILDFDGLWGSVQRHLKNQTIVELSVEDAVAARLNPELR